MALDVHIAGPGLDVTRRLAPGEPALILGRDNDCAVCLPDPERSVSRRHLSVWNDGDQLHFHVLSVVNGVTTGAGELPPGARGILQPGEPLLLSAFRLTVAPVPVAAPVPPPPEDEDPWAVFEREAAQLAADGAPQAPAVAEEDPFGDWGFQSTFGPGSPGGTLSAAALAPASDLSAFFAGLGLQNAVPPVFTRGEMEAIGRLTRIAVQGLVQAAQTAAAGAAQAPAGDGTAAEPRQPNPLRQDMPLESKLWYLFGGQAASAGFMPPDRAVAQVVADVTAHEQALAEALREALAGVLADFDPEALKARLLAGGARLFESSRAWEAFARDYAEKGASRDAWIQELVDRHFARAYARSLLRVKRDTAGRRRG